MPGDKEGFAGTGLAGGTRPLILAALPSLGVLGVPGMLRPLLGHLAPPRPPGCWGRLATTFPPWGWPAEAPLCPASGRRGLVSLLGCRRKRGAWRSGAGGSSSRGASSPAQGLASHWSGFGGGGESQAFPVYVTNRPPRKGKGLESALLLGGLQRAPGIESPR